MNEDSRVGACRRIVLYDGIGIGVGPYSILHLRTGRFVCDPIYDCAFVVAGLNLGEGNYGWGSILSDRCLGCSSSLYPSQLEGQHEKDRHANDKYYYCGKKDRVGCADDLF